MASKFIRENVFHPGVRPSDRRPEVSHFHGTTHATGTVRRAFQRIQTKNPFKGMLCWVVQWDTTNDRHIGKGVK